MGETVNLASRIQDLNKTFGSDILISAATEARLNDFVPVKKLPATQVKGKTGSLEIFRVL